MKKAQARIKQAFEENPMAVIAIASGAAIAIAKLIEAGTAANNSRAWKKEVNRRDRMTK